MARSSDDSEDEDFVVIGTALPEYDETEITKRPTTVHDLTAKDREGRRRFHGAFTGGFSAGYFNTVGSKEGFTPSTFVSSRSQKLEKREDAQSTQPEDFMDDEDLEEHGIAPRKFATAGSFTSEERKRKFENVTMGLTRSSALDLGSALGDIIIPEYLPIGIKLLRKMGWREGQGLGPRIRKKKKKTKKGSAGGKKIYGCALPPSDSDSEDSDSFIPCDLTFAPTDITPISLTPKDDMKGLGYHGLDPTLALPGSHINLFSNPVRRKKTSQGIKGHAFGVGALEDDDDDIYAQDSISNYDLTMRDADEDGQDSHFGWTAPRHHGKQKVPVSYVGKLLEGFCLSSKPLKPGKKFLAPSLPQNFKPYHWSRRRKKEDVEMDIKGKGNQMTAVDRGMMLGETPIMDSVFDLVSTKDKAQMTSAKEAIEMTKSLHASPSSSINNKEDSESDRLRVSEKKQPKFLSKFLPASSESDVSTQKDITATIPGIKGGQGIQPFHTDVLKQARFDQYLCGVRQKVPDPYSEVSTRTMTEWERAREKDEFSRSAKLFQPMSAIMSSRFVQGAMLDDKNESKMDKEDVTDEAKAAEMKMFGKLTREEFEWHPDKLLCRRFNVPNPYPGSDVIGLPNVKRDKYSIFNFLSVGDYKPKDPSLNIPDSDTKGLRKESDNIQKELKTPDRTRKKKVTLSSIFKVLDDPNFHKPRVQADSSKTDNSEPQKSEKAEETMEEEEDAEPDVDLFRAIFKNSDSEDSEDEEKNSEEKDNDSDESRIDDVEHNEKCKCDEEKKNEKESYSDAIVDPGPSAIDMMPDTLKEMKDSGESLKGNFSSENGAIQIKVVPEMSAMNSPLDNAVQNREIDKPKRSGSRWGPKSIFSVLDEVNSDMKHEKAMENEKEDIADLYGPALPPSVESTSQTYITPISDKVLQTFSEKKAQHREKQRNHHREKQKHKKEKKKKSKHKKEKKQKKRKKSSKSKKGTGSDADSESGEDSDESGEELLERLKHVSRLKAIH